MTLKRLLIVVTVLVVLAGGGMIWLGRVAYTPQGKARIIIAQLKGDKTSLRGWLLKHQVVRSGFSVPPVGAASRPAPFTAEDMVISSTAGIASYAVFRLAIARQGVAANEPQVRPPAQAALEQPVQAAVDLDGHHEYQQAWIKVD